MDSVGFLKGRLDLDLATVVLPANRRLLQAQRMKKLGGKLDAYRRKISNGFGL